MAQTKLGKALEHFKVESGMTNDEIADALGVSRTTLWSKVQGLTPIDIKQAKVLADLMGMTLEDFYILIPQVE